jgi:hypothetical protein
VTGNYYRHYVAAAGVHATEGGHMFVALVTFGDWPQIVEPPSVAGEGSSLPHTTCVGPENSLSGEMSDL